MHTFGQVLRVSRQSNSGCGMTRRCAGNSQSPSPCKKCWRRRHHQDPVFWSSLMLPAVSCWDRCHTPGDEAWRGKWEHQSAFSSCIPEGSFGYFSNVVFSQSGYLRTIDGGASQKQARMSFRDCFQVAPRSTGRSENWSFVHFRTVGSPWYHHRGLLSRSARPRLGSGTIWLG